MATKTNATLFASPGTGASVGYSVSVPTPTGADRLLRVAFGRSTGSSPTGLTYGGQVLAQVTGATVGTNPELEVWEIREAGIAAATDTNLTVVGGNCRSSGVAEAWSGVDQTTPFEDVTTASGTSAAPSVTVSSAAGKVVADAVCALGTDAYANAATVGAGQTDNGQSPGGLGTDAIRCQRTMSSYADGAVSVGMDWALHASGAWVAIGMSIRSSNNPPDVTITTPPSGLTVPAGTKIVVEFAASDDEDDDISGSAEVTSDNTDDGTDGVLGTGSGLTIETTGWADGARTITVTATDTGGLTGSASFNLTIRTAATGFDRRRFLIHALGGFS